MNGSLLFQMSFMLNTNRVLQTFPKGLVFSTSYSNNASF